MQWLDHIQISNEKNTCNKITQYKSIDVIGQREVFDLIIFQCTYKIAKKYIS